MPTRALHRAFARLSAALPGPCAVCRGWDAGRLCGACRARFAAPRPRCRTCALLSAQPDRPCPDCARALPPFERCVTALDYAWPWDGVIGAWKFNAALELAPALAALLHAAVQREAPPPPALVLPMPLGMRRLRERGYNQAWELAWRLAAALHAPADARLLLRLADTPAQSSLPRAERAANVRGAFGVAPGPAHRLRGQRIALVDDVMTTGATAAEAARTLRAAGAASVQLWVLARTPRSGDA